jgi:hypothetical protein
MSKRRSNVIDKEIAAVQVSFEKLKSSSTDGTRFRKRYKDMMN